MKYFYFAVDEFGDKFRRFERRLEAINYVNKRPGWTLHKEPRIIIPLIDWNNFEPGVF